MARAAVLPPTSPPKKTGRGRPRTKTAATTTESDAPSKAKTTTAATATAAKGKITEPKRRPGRPPSKKVEVEEISDEDEDDEIEVVDSKKGGRGKIATTAKGRGRKASSTVSAGTGRGRKAAAPAVVESGGEDDDEEDDDDEDELAQNEVNEVPKRRVGRPRTKPVAAEAAPAPRGRGRPKGSKSAKGPTTTEESEETGRKKRQVKGAADGAASKPIYITTNSTAMRSNIRRGPAKKKTVTFKDVSGSENQDQEEEDVPAPPARRRRGTGVPEGMGAKPVRKTAGTGRGRKPAADKKSESKPLSPKKATQVQKTLSSYASSDGEEDELSGAKDQVKLAVDSPSKHGSEKPGSTSPVRRINFMPNKPSKAVDENGEPTLHPAKSIDFSDSVYMSSPARRPPGSPFQFTMKESPRRGGAGLRGGNRAGAQPNLSPIQGSPLKSSPKKGNFGASSMGMPQPNLSPNHSPLKASAKRGSPVKGSLGTPSLSMPQPDFGMSSPLKTSPKKGNLGASFSSQSPVKSSTPFAARSILAQSPAKKVASPFKSSMTPRKDLVGTPAEISAGNERRGSSVRGESASGSPSKEEHTQAVDFDMEHSATHQMSPAVSETDIHAEVEDGPDSAAVDDAVEMVEEPNAEIEQKSEESHQYEQVNYDMGAHPGEPDQSVDQPGDEYDVNTEVIDEVEAKEENHTEHAAFDCTYLQEEVKDGIEECQRQVDHHSQPDQMDEYDDEHSEPGDDTQNQPEVKMNQENDLDLVSEVQSQRATPARLSPSAGLEDVFVDTPASRGFVEDADAQDNEVSGVDELRVEELAEGNFEEQDAHSEIQSIERDGRRTPMTFGTPEPVSAVSETASPYGAISTPEHFDEKDDVEPVEEQVEEQDIPKVVPNMEEQGKRTHMALGEPEPSDVDSAPASPVDSNEDTVQFGRDENKEPVDQHVEGQDAQDDAENTCGTVDEPQPRNIGSELASPFEVNEDNGNTILSHTPPPVPTPPIDTAVDKYGDPVRDTGRYSMASNDTSVFGSADTPDRNRRLTSPGMTPFKRLSLGKQQSASRNSLGFTSLTNQLSQWKASSPGKPQPEGRRRRGVFSLAGPFRRSSGVSSQEAGEVSYPDISKHPLADTQSLFGELPLRRDGDVGSDIYEDQEQDHKVAQEDVAESVESDRLPMSEISTNTELEMTGINSEEAIPDENAPFSQMNSPAPSTGASAGAVYEHDETDEKENVPSGSTALVTPRKNKINLPQTFHTVSKVPLKPEGEISPLKVSRKRGRSLSNASPVRSSPRLRKSIFSSKDNNASSYSPRKMPRLEPSNRQKRVSFAGNENEVRQQAESVNAVATSASPAKSPRKSIGASSQVLQGVVAHVDVHTTEGEDASGIFIELLQQMGARCVKNWAWNPRSSLSPVDDAGPKDGKVGITHVVFKDGGVRTLEKVRQAAGLVKCVGVGWVLDCERESKWLDEIPYAVDSTIIPRGGSKRRKSMQPRVLSNVNGTLIKTEQPTTSASGRRSGADMETMEDFMRLSPPIAHNESGTPETSRGSADPDREYCQTPRTPGSTINLDNIGMSPATPFFLQKASLVQQTCPPKQSRQGLFTASPSADGNGDGELSSQRLRFKLEAARRKSQGFRPRIRSPLVG